MRIGFRDDELYQRATDDWLATRVWGRPVAQKYRARILQLRAATDRGELSALRSLRMHALKGPRDGQWAIDLHGRWRLVVSFDGEFVIVEEVTNHYDD